MTYTTLTAGAQADYTNGFKNEHQVMCWLKALGHKVEDSTKHEDMMHDIDCYVDGIPTSIKTQQPKYYNAPFLFELEVQLRTTRQWVHSWYYNGKAIQYIVFRRNDTGGGQLYQLNKQDVLDFVEHHGWYRVTSLSPAVKARQAGHMHTDVKIGLLHQKDLIKNDVAYLMAESATLPKLNYNQTFKTHGQREPLSPPTRSNSKACERLWY